MRRAAALAAAAVMVLALGACKKGGGDKAGGAKVGGGDNGETMVEQGRNMQTVAQGKLTVCTDMPNPPFAFQDGSDLRGVDIDLMKAISGRLGISPDFRDIDRAGLFEALKSNQCDVVAADVAATDDVKRDNEVSSAYFEVYQSLLVRKGDDAKYHELSDLSGKPVGVAAGTASAEYARAHAGGASVKEFPNPGAVLAALKAGQIEAALQPEPVSAYQAKGDSAPVAVAKVFKEDKPVDLVFVMAKGKKDVVATINRALGEVRTDDSYRTVLTNYLGGTLGQA